MRSCSYIPLIAEWPDLTDQPDPVILDQIGRLQALAGEVTETALKMQLSLALDAVVERVSPQLPAGFEFLREGTHDRPDGTVPEVTGMDGLTGWRILNEDGYVVKPRLLVTSDPDQEGIITGTDPGGGAQYAPGKTVTMYEGYVPPDVNSDPQKIWPPE
jgi:hypothetical protein